MKVKAEPGTSDVKNRGWPKGKKRYPKSPGAPKQPLSGYVHFLNDRRETVRKESPDMSFAEISKKLANEWSNLPADEKTRYTDRAEVDKERYTREFEEYQKTDAYKEFMAEQEAKRDATSPGPSSSKKSKKSKSGKTPVKSESSTSTTTSGSTVKIEDSVNISDIPIFREEFIELNKAREAELKMLRKQATEFEEQNAVLQKHVDNMKSAVSKLETDTNLIKDNNTALEKQLDGLRQIVLESIVGKVDLPGFGAVNNDNVDAFVAKLHELAVKKSSENQELASTIKELTANLDLTPFSSALA